MRIWKTTLAKVALGLCLWCAGASAQTITTFAGTDFFFLGTPLPGMSAPLSNIPGVTVDAQDNVCAADSGNNIILEISPNGMLTIVAGNGIAVFSGDGGPVTAASPRGFGGGPSAVPGARGSVTLC